MNNYSKHIVFSDQTVQEALSRLNAISDYKYLTLFVLDEEKRLVGSITDGDIRRGFLSGLTIKDRVTQVMHRNYAFLEQGFSLANVLAIKKRNIKLVPLLDSDKRIISIFSFWEKKSVLPIEAVIMAGGRGHRLRPLTDEIPKPLLKLGDKPIIEHNIDRLINFGVTRFFVNVRYLGQKIIGYLGDGEEKGVEINYIKETEPLGTIGSVGLIKDFRRDHILITNSDLFTNIDYEDFYQSFLEEDADMAVASVPYRVDIPYAVLQLENNIIKSFKEKPTYNYWSNAGVYLIKRDLLNLIPKGEHYNATDLMQNLIDKGYRVIYYPAVGYWIDIGKPEDYQKAKELIRHIH